MKNLDSYSNKCGGCAHFIAHVINGHAVRRGECNCAPLGYFTRNKSGNQYQIRHSRARTACTKKCSRYIEE